MDLEPFHLERYFSRHEFTARFLLSSSDCESLSVKTLLEMEPGARAGLDDLWLGYTESLGNPELRLEISLLYDKTSADEIVVHTGAEEAILLTLRAVLGAEDHAIIHSPSYQSLTSVPKALGCEITPWMTSSETHWKLDLDFLKKSWKKNTKLVVVNCPHNPTGYLMSRSEWNELATFVADRGAILFSDEVYRGLEYDERDRLPAACDVSESSVSLGVMSKSFGLAGLRIGWIATRNEGLRRSISELKDYTTICNSAPSEYLSTIALRHKRKLWVRNLGLIKRNLALARAFFEEHSKSMEWIEPRAGCIGFPKLTTGQSASQFADGLLKETGTMLVPGHLFQYDDNYFRLGYGRENFPEALSRLEAYLSRR